MRDKPRKRGPKRKLPKGSVRTTVHLSPDQVAKAKRLGGTVAAGVRKALDAPDELEVAQKIRAMCRGLDGAQVKHALNGLISEIEREAKESGDE